jgi:hypothetical protein
MASRPGSLQLQNATTIPVLAASNFGQYASAQVNLTYLRYVVCVRARARIRACVCVRACVSVVCVCVSLFLALPPSLSS